MPALCILLDPPLQQNGVAQIGARCRPIELRREVVRPSIDEPLSRVAVKLRVGIKTSNLRGIPRPPHSKWADSEFHPRLCSLDPHVHLVNQTVDVGPAPIIPRKCSAGSEIFPPAVRVGELNGPSAPVLLLVRVEIVIDVNAIDVVPLDDVEHHADRLVANLRLSRIHPQHASISLHQLGVRDADMIWRWRRSRRRMTRAIGVEPRMQLEPTPVGFGHRKFERIVPRVGRSAHSPGQILRPWLVG